jgi:AraC-like DNA-binding protein
MRTAEMATVEWSDLFTHDMNLLADTLRDLYADHRATFTCPDPAHAEGRVHLSAAGGLSAALVHYAGLKYAAEIPLSSTPTAVACRTGSQTFSRGREERRVSAGQVFLGPQGVPFSTVACEGDYVTLGLPREAMGSLAEERCGIPAADLRFEAMAPPVSAAQQKRFAAMAEFICAELVTSEITEIYSLQAAELTRQAAGAFLDTFPSNAMTAGYRRGPGWVPTATARHAAEFIDAHADQPLTVDQIAAAVEVSTAALRYAFRRYFDTSPTGYMRRVRLERAHQELEAADPASGLTVATVARRWGWLSPSQFAVSYQRRFGLRPSRALHT